MADFTIPLPPKREDRIVKQKYRNAPTEAYDRWRSQTDTALFYQRKHVSRHITGKFIVRVTMGENDLYPISGHAEIEYKDAIVAYLEGRKITPDLSNTLIVFRFSAVSVDPGMVHIIIEQKQDMLNGVRL